MQNELAAWTSHIEKQHEYTEICIMEYQHVHAAWTHSMDMQQGHTARTCSMENQREYAARTSIMEK
jgi:hypothetical protein